MSVVMRLRVLCPCVLLVASAVGAAAQGVSGFAHAPAWNGEPLRLADALREALDRNPGLVAARAAVAPLAERPAQEGSLTPPRLDAQIWQWPITTLNPANVDMYMFMLEQELPGRGKRARRVTNAEKELALAEADVNMRRLGVAADVRRAYVTLALARRDLLAAYETGRALEQLVDVAQTTYAAGSGSQVSVVKALLEVSRVQQRMTTLGGDERMAAARLNTLMGRAPDAPVGALDEATGEPPPVVPADLARAALHTHPDVSAARAGVAQAESALAVAEQERQPDWIVQGGYMLLPGEAGAWTARVGLTWPSAPWAKTRLAASIAEAAKRRDAAAVAVAAAEARVRLMVAEAAARLTAARERLSVLRGTLVPQAQHLVDATRVAFANAQGSLGDALEARLVLLETELDEARALRELELARADLESALADTHEASDRPAEPPDTKPRTEN